jgi:hypothetical protein
MLEVTQQIFTSARGMCLARFRFVLLCFTGVLSTSCEKFDSPVDAALAQSMTVLHAVSLVGKTNADFALMMIPHSSFGAKPENHCLADREDDSPGFRRDLRPTCVAERDLRRANSHME